LLFESFVQVKVEDPGDLQAVREWVLNGQLDLIQHLYSHIELLLEIHLVVKADSFPHLIILEQVHPHSIGH